MFTAWHPNTRKITTYLDENGTSKNTCLLCEQLIQANTSGFTRGILYERVKLFPVQRNISDSHKDFYIQQIEKLAYHRSYYKILEKIMLLTLDINHLNPHQVTSVLGHIMPNDLALNPTVDYRINYLAIIVPYLCKVVV